MSTTSKLLTVTADMADEWLAGTIYERQRRRAEWHVERLALEMQSGRFMAGTQIHFGVLNGEMKLVNGQHTLAAISKTGIPVKLAILQTVVTDEKELGQLYGRHDRHRGRTPHDAFLGMGLGSELGMEEMEINAFAPALKFVLSNFRRPSVRNNPELASLEHLAVKMKEWAPTALTYFDCVRDARHGMKGAFRRAPVVAVGLATISAKPERAKEFWLGATNDDGLHKHDPRRSLNQFLAQNSSGYGDPIIYMRNIATAWNAFYESRELQFLRPGDTGKFGVTLRGTSYKAAKPKGQKTVAVESGDEDSTTQMRQTHFGELGAHQ